MMLLLLTGVVVLFPVFFGWPVDRVEHNRSEKRFSSIEQRVEALEKAMEARK
jgi:hypothetical protein